MSRATDRLKSDQRKYHQVLAARTQELIASGVSEVEANEQATLHAKQCISTLQAKRRAGTNRGRKVRTVI